DGIRDRNVTGVQTCALPIFGAMAASPESSLSLPLLLVLLTVAAVVGDAVNYAVGYRLGPAVFKYEKSWLFNKKHLLRAQEFYERSEERREGKRGCMGGGRRV